MGVGSKTQLLMDTIMVKKLDTSMDRILELHVTLPEELLAGLDRIANERRVKRTSIVREAITSYLDRIESERIEREMEAYVEALAPHSGEFVAETEPDTMERLLSETEW